MFKDKCINVLVESTEEALKRGVKVIKFRDSIRGPRSITPKKVSLDMIDRNALPPELRKLLDSLKKEIT